MTGEELFGIDDASGIINLLIEGYKPRMFKKGDIVVCLKGNPPCRTNGFDNEFIKGYLYKVYRYENYYSGTGCQCKSMVQIEGSSQLWYDDKFELAPGTQDVEYTDVTNQKLLK